MSSSPSFKFSRGFRRTFGLVGLCAALVLMGSCTESDPSVREAGTLRFLPVLSGLAGQPVTDGMVTTQSGEFEVTEVVAVFSNGTVLDLDRLDNDLDVNDAQISGAAGPDGDCDTEEDNLPEFAGDDGICGTADDDFLNREDPTADLPTFNDEDAPILDADDSCIWVDTSVGAPNSGIPGTAGTLPSTCANPFFLTDSAAPMIEVTARLSVTLFRRSALDVAPDGDADGDGLSNDVDNCPFVCNNCRGGRECGLICNPFLASSPGIQIDVEGSGFVVVDNGEGEDPTEEPDGMPDQVGDACQVAIPFAAPDSDDPDIIEAFEEAFEELTEAGCTRVERTLEENGPVFYCADADGDGIRDDLDNCPQFPNSAGFFGTQGENEGTPLSGQADGIGYLCENNVEQAQVLVDGSPEFEVRFNAGQLPVTNALPTSLILEIDVTQLTCTFTATGAEGPIGTCTAPPEAFTSCVAVGVDAFEDAICSGNTGAESVQPAEISSVVGGSP